jgi:hypothetical protein
MLAIMFDLLPSVKSDPVVEITSSDLSGLSGFTRFPTRMGDRTENGKRP